MHSFTKKNYDPLRKSTTVLEGYLKAWVYAVSQFEYRVTAVLIFIMFRFVRPLKQLNYLRNFIWTILAWKAPSWASMLSELGLWITCTDDWWLTAPSELYKASMLKGATHNQFPQLFEVNKIATVSNDLLRGFWHKRKKASLSSISCLVSIVSCIFRSN